MIGLARDLAAAEVLGDRHAEPGAERHQVGEIGPLGEAFHPEVGRVHAEDEGGAIADGRRVVGGPRLVGRADLAQHRARLRHDVGHPEAAADLHELAARHDHFAPGGERRQHQQRGRRVVVHDDGRLGAGEMAEQRLGVDVAAPARAPREVVLERRVAAAHGGEPGERRLRERRAPQVRVQDDPGRVDHGDERGGEAPAEVFGGERFDARGGRRAGVDGRVAVGDGGAHERGRFAERVGGGLVPEARAERANPSALLQLVDRRQDAKIRHGVLC